MLESKNGFGCNQHLRPCSSNFTATAKYIFDFFCHISYFPIFQEALYKADKLSKWQH